MIEEGYSHAKLLENHVGDLVLDLIMENDVNYACTCSREKALSSMYMLSVEDFKDIIEKQETLNVDCEMCGVKYRFDQTDINLVYKKSGKASVHWSLDS